MKLTPAFALAAVLGFGSVAQAAVISGTSSAFGESINLVVTPVVGVQATVTSGPLAQVQGLAPAPYNLSNSAIGATVAITTGLTGLTAELGVLNAEAASNVDGTAGPKSATASASIAGLLLSNILSVGAVTSSASVSGDFGALNIAGNATIAGLTVLGAQVTVATAANTVLFNALGLRIVANEQLVTANSITVNALDITFTNFVAGTDILNGSIILAQSQAALFTVAGGTGGGTPPVVAVPEPASLALFGIGMLGLGAVRRRQAARQG